jgi:hypothetical protein
LSEVFGHAVWLLKHDHMAGVLNDVQDGTSNMLVQVLGILWGGHLIFKAADNQSGTINGPDIRHTVKRIAGHQVSMEN